MSHVARRFLDQGITRMVCFAEATNPSCRFYGALGGVKMEDDPGCGNYVWQDIAGLVRED
jgi:hypothetical protein